MLARARFDQISRAKFAIEHPSLFRAIGRVPYTLLHRLLVALIRAETWLRYPLLTLRALDSVDETFSLLAPDGERFGLTAKARREFRKNLLYYQIADLVVLLTSLDKPGFRRRALRFENEEALLREREEGPGAIVAGFRMGAYPAVPWVLGSLGFPVSMIVGTGVFAETGRGLGRELVPDSADGVRFMGAEDARTLARSLETLNAGGLVGTLLELAPIEYARTTEVQLFEWRIKVPYGVAYLAAATGRSIVPAALTREDGPRFTMRFGEPLPAPARDRASILECTQRLYRALEERVLQFPGQWMGWPMFATQAGVELRPTAPTEAPTLS